MDDYPAQACRLASLLLLHTLCHHHIATTLLSYPCCEPLLLRVCLCLCACRRRSLGANDFQVFWNVTLPNIRWALLYGIILTNAVRHAGSDRCVCVAARVGVLGAGYDICAAEGPGCEFYSSHQSMPLCVLQRAMGEFGAVSVISGNIIGQTQTLTLYVESAYKVGWQCGGGGKEERRLLPVQELIAWHAEGGGLQPKCEGSLRAASAHLDSWSVPSLPACWCSVV